MFCLQVFPGLKQRFMRFRIKILDPFDREIQIYNPNKIEAGLKLLVPERKLRSRTFFFQGHYSCVSGD